MYSKCLPLKAKFLVRFALWPVIFEIQACWKSKCTEWPQNDLEHIRVKSTMHIESTYSRGTNLCSFALQSAFFEIQDYRKSNKLEMHRMTSEWPWKVKGTKYRTYTKYLPPRSKVWPASLYDQPFSRYNFVEYEKYTEWPQKDVEHLAVKSTLYTLPIYRRGQHFIPFCSINRRFRGTKLSKKNRKSRKCTEWIQTDLKYLMVKSIPHTISNTSCGANFGLFRSTTSRVQGIAHCI